MKGKEFLERIAKAEKKFHDLVQNDESVVTTLAKMEEQNVLGISELRKSVTEDLHLRNNGISGIGNLTEHRRYMESNSGGAHVVIDANDIMRQIHKIHGPEAQNQAVVTMGKALKAAQSEVGSNHVAIHRVGGGKFYAHLPTKEHAAFFARSLRTNLQAYPPVGGSHELSPFIGVGDDLPGAETDAVSARKKMRDQKFQAPSV